MTEVKRVRSERERRRLCVEVWLRPRGRRSPPLRGEWPVLRTEGGLSSPVSEEAGCSVRRRDRCIVGVRGPVRFPVVVGWRRCAARCSRPLSLPIPPPPPTCTNRVCVCPSCCVLEQERRHGFHHRRHPGDQRVPQRQLRADENSIRLPGKDRGAASFPARVSDPTGGGEGNPTWRSEPGQRWRPGRGRGGRV